MVAKVISELKAVSRLKICQKLTSSYGCRLRAWVTRNKGPRGLDFLLDHLPDTCRNIRFMRKAM